MKLDGKREIRASPGGGTRRAGSRRKDARIKKLLPSLACVAAGVVLYVLLTVTGGEEGPVSPEGRILRDGYGGEEQEYKVIVEGLEETPVPVTVTVSPRLYTEQEADEVFTRIMDSMETRIRGENPSLMEVRGNLKLPTFLEEEGVRLRWYSSDPELLDSAGNIGAEIEKEQTVILSAELSAGNFRQTYEIPVRVLPPVRTEQERQMTEFKKELRRRDQGQREEPYLALPEIFEGKRLRYSLEESSDYSAILLIGVLLAVLMAAREQSGEKEKEQKREKELLLDYADLLSKVMVLTGAGLTVRNAWERIVKDYEAGREQGRQKTRAAYEEMRQTYYQMQSGMSEGEAYRQFGKRCRLQPYLKLSGLLEQNRKSGTKNMREILQGEMADALEQRKNLARRLGEEAGTKLLLPLFMMLGIVMVMIMVPAMMTMG